MHRIDLKGQYHQALQKLVGLGYFKYVAEEDHERIQEEVLSSIQRGFIHSDWDVSGVAHDRRSYPVDTEGLDSN